MGGHQVRERKKNQSAHVIIKMSRFVMERKHRLHMLLIGTSSVLHWCPFNCGHRVILVAEGLMWWMCSICGNYNFPTVFLQRPCSLFSPDWCCFSFPHTLSCTHASVFIYYVTEFASCEKKIKTLSANLNHKAGPYFRDTEFSVSV